ncbi:MAG: hypothetical protein JST85_18780 [Acidobacteria bacterium]|nr:hypothetical protein [Acidobacteriota bacterium]
MILRIIGIRALLCDNCNCQFRAFSPLPPKSRRPRSSSARKTDVFNTKEAVDLGSLTFNSPPAERHDPKLTLPISAKPASSVQPMQMEVAVAGGQHQPRIAVNQIAPVRQNLRTEITKLYQQDLKAEVAAKANPAIPDMANLSMMTCPECGSHNIKRRKRNAFEKVFLSFTDHKPYVCRKCDSAFYSKSSEQE